MIPQLTQPTTNSPFAPVYQSDLARTIGVLQQLQVLCVTQGDVSLADVIQVLHDMQQEFGEDSRLEEVIQSLIGQHLRQQLTARRLTRQRHSIQAMEVYQ